MASFAFLFLIGCSDFSKYSVPDLLPYYKKDIALIVARPTTAVDFTLIQEITKKLEKDLPTFSNFSKVVTTTQIKSMFKNSAQLPIILSQYTQTFALSGVSDKNFSVKLGEILDVEQLLIIQFNQYPCEECDGKKNLIAKFNLLEAQTGMLLWRGRYKRELELEEIEKQAFDAIVIETSDLILNELKESFIVPWHRIRYENLKNI